MSLNLAMLSDDVGAGQLEGGLAAGDPAQTAILETEVAVQDIEIAVDQGGDISATIDTAEGTADVIEGANDKLEEAAEAGEEVPPAAMEAIRLLVNGHMKNLGFESAGFARRADRALGMESFGPRMDKTRSLKLATEAVGEMLSNIWEAIKKAFKAAWDWVKGYWNKFFGGAERLKSAYENLVKGIEGKRSVLLDDAAEWNARQYKEVLPGIDAAVKTTAQKNATPQINKDIDLKSLVSDFVKNAKSGESVINGLHSGVAPLTKTFEDAVAAVEAADAGGKKAKADKAKTATADAMNALRSAINGSGTHDAIVFGTRVYTKPLGESFIFDSSKPAQELVEADVKITISAKMTVGDIAPGAQAGYNLVSTIVKHKNIASDYDKDLDKLSKALDRVSKAMASAMKDTEGGKAEKKYASDTAKESMSSLRSVLFKAAPALESAVLTGAQKAYSLMASAVSKTQKED